MGEIRSITRLAIGSNPSPVLRRLMKTPSQDTLSPRERAALCSVLPILLGSLLIACTATAARAATIKGTVLDPSGRAVANVQVSLLQSLTALDERQTDAKGEYEFTGVARGSYRLVANAPGFSATPVDVEVREDQAAIDLASGDILENSSPGSLFKRA